MTYEDRQKYRALVEGLAELEARLAEGEPDAPLSREEGLELLGLLKLASERMSPERLDGLMDTIAQEAARRAGALAVSRGG